MDSQYVYWLQKKGVPLFKGGGIYWRLYQKALIPAQAHPCYVELNDEEAKQLLKESGAWFLRYTSNPQIEESSWWYIVCNSFDSQKLTSKMRNQIKKANSLCTVKQIEISWLAENSYECYYAAHQRYTNSETLTEETFKNNILSGIGGPYEYWGVFVGENLVGYCQCIVDGENISTNVIKYHPDYLKSYSSYALINKILEHYVVEKGFTISNGTRSIVHDTNMQEYLLKFGFKKQFCCLNIIYQPWLNLIIKVLYPFKKLLNSLPNTSLTQKVQGLLFQEELRRNCNE